jgi:hypothetical protein
MYKFLVNSLYFRELPIEFAKIIREDYCQYYNLCIQDAQEDFLQEGNFHAQQGGEVQIDIK